MIFLKLWHLVNEGVLRTSAFIFFKMGAGHLSGMPAILKELQITD